MKRTLAEAQVAHAPRTAPQVAPDDKEPLPMSHIITKHFRVSRRAFLKGFTLTSAQVTVGLPPLVSMFNATGTAYAASAGNAESQIESRFVLWFNGNGIPERYWIPA